MITLSLSLLAMFWLATLRRYPHLFTARKATVRPNPREYHFGGGADLMPTWQKQMQSPAMETAGHR